MCVRVREIPARDTEGLKIGLTILIFLRKLVDLRFVLCSILSLRSLFPFVLWSV